MTSAPTIPKVTPGEAPGPITEAEFALLRDLIYRSSGIFLSENKQALLVARLTKRLRALHLDSFGSYYERLISGQDPDERTRMLECVVTNETRFFREPDQFELLETVAYPRWKEAARRSGRTREIRAWSAACSTGEEAYSLAMSLLWHLPADDGWRVRVLGTDISRRVLDVALAGTWSSDQARHVPHGYLARFMRRGTRAQEGKMCAGPELRSVVRFGEVNLHAEGDYPANRSFDLIFCRNVLIYFDQDGRNATLRRLAGHLAPGGYLLLGHAERPGRALEGLERVGATVYRAPVDHRTSATGDLT